jgi:hypothetical protein
MKKLLLSVAALMVATLMFSLDDKQDVKEDVVKDNLISVEQRAELNS